MRAPYVKYIYNLVGDPHRTARQTMSVLVLPCDLSPTFLVRDPV